MEPQKKKQKGKILLIILLALVCIGGVELAVCRVAAPELFQTITAPVVDLAHRVGQTGQKLLGQVGQAGHALLDRLTPSRDTSEAEESQPPVNQLAGDPAIDEQPPAEDPSITEFTTRSGREVLTGGVADVVYYNQAEEPWASSPFGRDVIKGYGCGPTALAMLVSTLTDQTVNPAQMAAWAYESGYWASGSGSHLSIIEGAAAAYGLDVQAWSDRSADGLQEQLASGHLFVALMTRGHFTNAGHFILLRGVTLEGTVLVADPNSRERSLAAWDPQLILDELSSSTASGAPLWRFTLPQSGEAPENTT